MRVGSPTRGSSTPKRMGSRTIYQAMKIAESLLNALAEPVLLLDNSLRAVMANPAFYHTFNLPPGHLAGVPAHELMSGDSSQARMKAVLDAVVGGLPEVEGVEVKGAPPPAPPRVLALNARRMTVVEGAPEMVLVEFRDITREREKELRIGELNDSLRRHADDLQRINEDLESFAHSASHDLRTPLRMTNKVASLLLREHGDQLPAGAVEKAEMILSSTEEMGNLIENLLAFSRMSHAALKKRLIDPSRVVRESARILKDERHGRDVRIALGELPPCIADRALLKQVYLNLLANALKFTRPCDRAEITIGCRRQDDENVYYVSDNGVGLDTSRTDIIFKSFQRLRNAQGFEGSGIGLSLVKRIIDCHGGRIWAEGEAGQGATINFTLGDEPPIERK